MPRRDPYRPNTMDHTIRRMQLLVLAALLARVAGDDEHADLLMKHGSANG